MAKKDTKSTAGKTPTPCATPAGVDEHGRRTKYGLGKRTRPAPPEESK